MNQTAKISVTLLVAAILTASALIFAAPATDGAVAAEARATFKARDLPNGLTWTVTCLGALHSATTPNNIVVSDTSGHWSWSAGTITGATGIQYVPNPKSGSESGTKTINIAYTTQYQVSFTASIGGSVTTPNSPQWYNKATGGVAITAVANTGYHFTSWTTTGSITVAAPSSASTTITVNGPGTVKAYFAITQIATDLTVACTPQTVDKTGSMTTTIQGALTAADSPLADQTITLTYNDATEQAIAMVKTRSDGSYSYTWTVPASLPNGFHVVTAAYTGSNNPYMSSTAQTSSGSGGLFVLPEYTLGGLGALCALFGAFGIIKVRSNRKHNH